MSFVTVVFQSYGTPKKGVLRKDSNTEFRLSLLSVIESFGLTREERSEY